MVEVRMPATENKKGARDEKNEQRIFNSKNKSVTIKGAKRINVPVSAGSWHRQNRNT